MKTQKEMNVVRIEVDVAYDCPTGEVLEIIEAHGGAIETFTACGPAGGNPCLVLTFPDLDSAKAYIDAWSMGESDIEDHLI